MSGYDDQSIFAKILRGEIPCDKVYEDEYALAFNDIAPQMPVHVLIIPKGQYISIDDFAVRASAEEVTGFFSALAHIARDHGLSESGFRTIANTGVHGGQEVPHFHMHLLGGENVGPMLSRKR